LQEERRGKSVIQWSAAKSIGKVKTDYEVISLSEEREMQRHRHSLPRQRREARRNSRRWPQRGRVRIIGWAGLVAPRHAAADSRQGARALLKTLALAEGGKGLAKQGAEVFHDRGGFRKFLVQDQANTVKVPQCGAQLQPRVGALRPRITPRCRRCRSLSPPSGFPSS